MSFLKQPDLGPDFAPYQFFRSNFGFVPNLFSAQSLLPRVLEVEADLTELLLVREGSLSPQQRQYIMLLVGSAKQNTYCFTLHWETLRALGASEDHVREVVANHRDAGLSQIDVALLDITHCKTCQVIYDSALKTLKIVTDSDSFELPEDVAEPLIASIMTKVRSES